MAEEYIEKVSTKLPEWKVMTSSSLFWLFCQFRGKLEGLWDKALLTQGERAAFITGLHEKGKTMNDGNT